MRCVWCDNNYLRYDMSEKIEHDETNKINHQMRENLMARKCSGRPDARRFTCAKYVRLQYREVGSCKLLPLSKSPISGPSDQGVHDTSPLCRQRNDKGDRLGLSPFCCGNHPIQALSTLMAQPLKQQSHLITD